MDFTFTEEQEDFRAVLRKFLAARSSEPDVRRTMETAEGVDRQVWRELADDVGVVGMLVPEEFGGLGLGYLEMGIALEEFGGTLACIPFLSSAVLASQAILMAGDTHTQAHWLPQIAAGSTIATVALSQGSRDWNPRINTCRASGAGGWTLSGTKTYVLNAMVSDLFVVSAELDGDVGLFLIESDMPGLTITATSTMDLTRRFAELTLVDTPAILLGRRAEDDLERLHSLALTALAAEQIGGAQQCLDQAVGYACTRFQFGRAIGSFQAIKHKCADNLINIEAARAAVGFALWSAGNETDEEFALAARMAKAVASDAYLQVASDNIQVHGGIGFTWEHSAHLYLKRAKSSELWLGEAAVQRDWIGRRFERPNPASVRTH